jgi:hypothetical protein
VQKKKLIVNGDNEFEGVANSVNKPYTLKELIELFEVDTTYWEAKSFTVNHWDVTNKDGKTFKNYQSKVRFERIKSAFEYDVMKKDLLECALKRPKVKPVKYIQKGEHLLEINIFDLHLGKLAWAGETGENYDYKIASKRFMGAVESFIGKGSLFGFNRIVFAVGQDFFHIDTPRNTTTKGTPQDCDLRWRKLYKVGRKLLTDSIDMLKQYAPVDVVVISGNHDDQTMFYAGDCLEAWYRNDDNVSIDNRGLSRKVYVYGRNLIGYSHKNPKDIVSLFAQEYSKEWGSTVFKEIHIGHLHSKKELRYEGVVENHGVVVRQMRSLSGSDYWHYSGGYLSVKGAEAFLWSRENGIVCTFENNLFLKGGEGE